MTINILIVLLAMLVYASRPVGVVLSGAGRKLWLFSRLPVLIVPISGLQNGANPLVRVEVLIAMLAVCVGDFLCFKAPAKSCKL